MQNFYFTKNLALAVLALLLFSTSSQAQLPQLGPELLGSSEKEYFGNAVSISGNGMRVAVSGRNLNQVSSWPVYLEFGQVSLYEYVNGNWTPLGTPLNGDADGDRFGQSISLSKYGNRVAISAPYVDPQNQGEVKVYELQSGEWKQIANALKGNCSNCGFGYTVALSAGGERLAISAPRRYRNGQRYSGIVRVYELKQGKWDTLGATIRGEFINDKAGYSMDLSDDGNHIIIGSPYNPSSLNGTRRSEAGLARVYRFDGKNWNQLGNDLVGDKVDDHFGQTVSISSNGQRVIVGAPDQTGTAKLTGQAKVFEYKSGTWVQLGSDFLGESDSDCLGTTVSISGSGSRVAVGIPNLTGLHGLGHYINIFEFRQGNWFQLTSDLGSEITNGNFGHAIDLSADGTAFIGGDPTYDKNGSLSGLVRIYGGAGSPLASNNRILNKLALYPNPTSGSCRIEGEKISELTVIDLLGRVVEAHYDGNQIDLSQLPAGVYSVRIKQFDSKVSTQRVLKE